MASDIQRIGDLEIAQDHEFQRFYWKLQRLIWVGMVVLLGMALLGLFGSGPLSYSTAGRDGDRLQLKFQRFGLFQAPTTLEIRIGADPGSAEEVEFQLELSRAYLDGVQIESMEPVAERVVAAPDSVSYVFLRSHPQRPTRVQIHLKPEKRGLLRGRIGLKNGSSLGFRQWIYP